MKDWTNLDIHKFVKDRNEALLSADFGKIMAYLIMYEAPIPPNTKILYMSAKKALEGITSISESVKEEAYKKYDEKIQKIERRTRNED